MIPRPSMHGDWREAKLSRSFLRCHEPINIDDRPTYPLLTTLHHARINNVTRLGVNCVQCRPIAVHYALELVDLIVIPRPLAWRHLRAAIVGGKIASRSGS